MATSASSAVAAVGRLVPSIAVSDDAFAKRFRVLLVVLWLHIPLILVVGELKDAWGSSMAGMGMPGADLPTSHEVVLYLTLVLTTASAVLASIAQHRVVQTYAVTVGLILGAAGLVHAGGGLTDLHFAFFVALAAIGLLQSAGAFGVATLLVACHHLIAGIWMPDAVFSDPRVRDNPLPWVLLHTVFVAALCIVQITYWHFIAAERAALDTLKATQARIMTDRLVAEERAIVEILSAAERATVGRRQAAAS